MRRPFFSTREDPRLTRRPRRIVGKTSVTPSQLRIVHRQLAADPFVVARLGPGALVVVGALLLFATFFLKHGQGKVSGDHRAAVGKDVKLVSRGGACAPPRIPVLLLGGLLQERGLRDVGHGGRILNWTYGHIGESKPIRGHAVDQ